MIIGKIDKNLLKFFQLFTSCLEFEAEIIPYKSKHEPIFLTNLFRTKYEQNYRQFLLDVNCWRYEENMNMQTINRIVPSTIEHCLSVLPNIETNKECKEVYDNMKTLSNSPYYLNQFLELLPTYVPPGKAIKLIE